MLKRLPENYVVPFLESSLDIERSQILKEELIQRIRADGPMTFAEFMHESLYGNFGFYSTRGGGIHQGTPFLTETTSPEQDQLFAQVIGTRIAGIWEEMGKPAKFIIVEMGAGTGALAKSIIETIRSREPELYEHVCYIILDLSPSLIEAQRTKNTDDRVRWIYGSAIDLPLRNIEGIFISNELVDSFPFHRVAMERGHIKEIYVSEENGRLVDWKGKPSQEFRDYFKTVGIRPEEGVELHVCLESKRWMAGVARALKRGYVITFDYGDKAELIFRKGSPWHNSAMAGTNYSLEGSAEKAIYDRVGGVDITTYIDFTALLKAGERYGLIGLLVSQLDFLTRSGASTSVAEKVRIGELGTIKNLDQIAQLFNTRHKVLIQAKGGAGA